MRFRLIEKNESAIRRVSPEGIQPRTQEVFEDLGVIDQVVAAVAFIHECESKEDGSYSEKDMGERSDGAPISDREGYTRPALRVGPPD
ncbi:hypothetical protein [Brucella intermedia]|uniref:hypothetical protein n=1 Tax=Brucella intermedia TaxID=94625 RepID=UPI0031400C0A